MTTLTKTRLMNAAEVEELRAPRHDLVIEKPDGDDTWTMVTGPFRHYRRTLTVEPAPTVETRSTTSEQASEPLFEVTEQTDYKVELPLWWVYLWLPMRFGLASLDRTPRRRFWWSKEVVSADTSRLIGHLGTIGMMAGYMGVLIGQTITFAAADFGADDSDQADTLAATRIGVFLSLVFLSRADRIGRRPLAIGFAAGAIIFTALGAAAPNMFALGATQTVSRGLTTGLLTLITLAATEEVPASSRALSISFMTLATGFGAALVVWTLPVADRFDGAWRLVFLAPLLFTPLLWWVRGNLPETRRYQAATAEQSPGKVNWRRFALVGTAAFVSAIYLSPASQLRNEYLTDDRGFSATDVSVFQLSISIPATLVVPLAGLIADRKGRRWIGAGALAASAIFSAISYQSTGWLLWFGAGMSVSMAAAAIPALRGYQTELFPTRARGKVGGLIDVVGLAGSALGLVVVGRLAVRFDDLGSAIGVLVFAPILVAVLIIAAFPETASKELEEFNPDDPRLDTSPVTPS